MSTFTPSFDLSGSSVMSDDQFEEELKKDAQKGSSFQPGHYELKVLNAYFDGEANDPSWVKIKVELGDEDKSIRNVVMIPTTLDIKYQKPGGKPTLFVWNKLFSPFFQALGEKPKPSTLASIIKKYTKNLKEIEVSVKEDGEVVEKKVNQLSELIGKSVEVDIGYDGAYIKRKEDSEVFEILKNGKPLEKDGESLEGESYEDCQALAIEHDIKLGYLGVQKYYAKEIQQADDEFNDL